jgi:hypothetical protein
MVWTGLGWLRTGTSGELLWMRQWTSGFNKLLGNYRVASQLVASRVVLSSIELAGGTVGGWTEQIPTELHSTRPHGVKSHSLHAPCKESTISSGSNKTAPINTQHEWKCNFHTNCHDMYMEAIRGTRSRQVVCVTFMPLYLWCNGLPVFIEQEAM